MDADKLYSIPASAEFLGGISTWTIHDWLSRGKLMRTKVGRRTFVKESELRKMIRDQGPDGRERYAV
jgi:hypothetical protein